MPIRLRMIQMTCQNAKPSFPAPIILPGLEMTDLWFLL